MVLFEVPTGVVADVWGRRVSYLLGTLTLAGSTFLYWLLWQMSAPFWAWAIVSMLLGLGFTFFSGAVEAWLVDALHYAEYDGSLESVMGRGQMVGGAAMLGGSVLGGVIAQATNLGVPFLMRVGVLVGDVLRRRADDARPRLHAGAVARIRSARCRRCSTRRSTTACSNPPVRWVMLAAPFAVGRRHLHLLRAAAVPARALGRPERLQHRRARGGDRRRGADRRRLPRAVVPASCSGSGRRR